MRRRKLPAEQVVWTVIGMGLFRDRSTREVVHHLSLVLPGKTPAPAPAPAVATSSAVVQAGDRLGAAPLEALFETTAARWATASADTHRWRGLAVYGVDGSSLRIPDTPENEAAFGRPGSSRGVAGDPQLRMVALRVLRSHLLAGLALGPWSVGETTLAEPLWTKLPDRSLVILDRGFPDLWPQTNWHWGWVAAVEHDGLEEIRKVPGYHDEPLKGDRTGQRSIRLSRAYRAIYEIKRDTTKFVSVEEVSKHDY